MLDKQKISALVIGPLFLFICAAPVTQAALVQGTMQGFIAEHAETGGEGINVFGLDGAGLVGQSFVVDFYYHTDIAPVTGGGVSSVSARTIYDSSDPGLDWLGLSLTINNITYDVVGSNRHADVIDIYADPNLSNNDSLQLAIEGNSGPFNDVSFRRQFLDVSVSLKNHILDGATLPTTLSSTEIERVFNSANFSINDFDFDAVTGELLYERFVNFELDVQSVEATVVPIPGSIWLFGSAVLGLFITSRKKY